MGVSFEAKVILSLIIGFYYIIGFILFSRSSDATGSLDDDLEADSFISLEGSVAKLIGGLLILIGTAGMLWVWYFL